MSNYQAPGVYVEEVSSGAAPISGVGTSTAGFVGLIPDTVWVPKRDATTGIPLTDYHLGHPIWTREPWPMPENRSLAKELTPVLVTNFTEFTEKFGSQRGTANFTADLEVEKSRLDENNALAHAVRGFFLNGGTRCWIVRVSKLDDVELALDSLENIDEIAIVAVPVVKEAAWLTFHVPEEADRGPARFVGGVLVESPSQTSATRFTAIKNYILGHCKRMGDRFAVLDGAPEDPSNYRVIKGGVALNEDKPLEITGGVEESTFGAIYFPWIDISGRGDFLPPCGHIAGIYARVDSTRGVHKAPANEVLRGAMGLQHRINKAKQAALNPEGVNAIREFDGTIKVWGARTLKKNDEFTYINVRRLFLYLKESIDEGTQWAVFEPNSPHLWAKIVRNVSAFLHNVWSAGALFGDTPEQAFYVKCDAETNPPSIRDNGQVVTEIGVAVVKPAEFVIFRIGQKTES